VLPRVTPYRDYLAWIAGRIAPGRFRRGRRLWRGWRSPPCGAARSRAAAGGTGADHRCAERGRSHTALTRQARQQGLTLNTFIQTAWAILLGRLPGAMTLSLG